ncbi:Hypothetical predicted protein [Podarcis lilfordi]|uniref:Uncharacterized protein n=1 Tax=Podarcis lilfordi TaxID=74358 RepID=A0AA35K7F6_9SAUR|nr:Hypothetical predicted protein [Podarcis lilfordi]
MFKHNMLKRKALYTKKKIHICIYFSSHFIQMQYVCLFLFASLLLWAPVMYQVAAVGFLPTSECGHHWFNHPGQGKSYTDLIKIGHPPSSFFRGGSKGCLHGTKELGNPSETKTPYVQCYTAKDIAILKIYRYGPPSSIF